ncbi:MAG TPA: heavy metal translocating P-type ATPase [Chloroflexi bacterium]|nr:heavy metal translocating P-type ATPase [Chloroflexota bacterium]
MEIKTYNVQGLSCIDCADQIQKSVGQLEGVEACEVDYATGRLVLRVDTPAFDVDPVARIVKDTGHTLRAGPRQTEAANPVVAFVRFLFAKPDTVLTAVSALLALLGLVLIVFDAPEPARLIPFGLAIALGGWPVLRQAFQEVVRARSLGINVLMVIAVTGAILIGEWVEAAIVVVLFSLGEALEGYASERARGALESLLDIAPPVALRLGPEGSTEETPVERLVVGDRVLVRPGDRVSVDGVVLAGQSAVDQAPITGESVPVDKAPGDEVFAGTVNTFGALEVEMTRLVADNTLNRMVALVQEAQSRQAPVQRFVERFARVYTPLVTVFAFLVAVMPPLLFEGQMFWGESGWLMRALQMLVIACPCALVISTPVSVVSALTNAAAHGVLVKGGRTLEALGRVQVFAFDKTGTLTEGRPVATDVLDVCEDVSHPQPHNGLAYAAAIEAQSSHPLARALVAEAKAQKIGILPAEDVTILSGRGVTGRVNGAQVTVASHPFFDAMTPHAEAICHQANCLAAEGKTVIMVCHDDHVCSIFAVADRPRPESAETLEALRAIDQIRTVMLTGDSVGVAEAIGRLVGVDDVRAELLPEDKVAAIRELAAEETAVAMVGDGVNDAPALAQATVGIAMGGAASAQAMETADVVLMGDDLTQLPFIVRLSRRTRQIIRANVVFALVVKALVFALAAAGLATLWMAIVADVGASLAVILNGMRLRNA